jgi:hypothetical protein
MFLVDLEEPLLQLRGQGTGGKALEQGDGVFEGRDEASTAETHLQVALDVLLLLLGQCRLKIFRGAFQKLPAGKGPRGGVRRVGRVVGHPGLPRKGRKRVSLTIRCGMGRKDFSIDTLIQGGYCISALRLAKRRLWMAMALGHTAYHRLITPLHEHREAIHL